MKSRVTSQQVAKRAGVSRTTVSFILNDVPGVKFPQETRDRVFQAADELGYVPDAAARTLASGKTRTLGLVITQAEHLRIVDAFISQVIYGLNEVSGRAGFRVLIEGVENAHQPDTYTSLVRAKKIDGLLVLNSRLDDAQLSGLIDDGYPVVLIGSVGHQGEYSVTHVNKTAQAVGHLISLGHERIAHVTLAPPSDHATSFERLKIYRETLTKAGLPKDDTLVRYGNYSAESGFVAMQSLLARKPYPSAVFVANDTVAIGAMAAVQQRGLRIPRDVAVVGYDDIPLAAYTAPPLTTVRQSAVESGRLAGQMLIQLVHGEKPKKRQVRLDADLIIRESCGAALPMKR